jgi:hypothetical protein
MHARPRRAIVVLQTDPAAADDRFEPLAGPRPWLRLDAEQPHVPDRLHGDGVARRDASDEKRVAAKNCRSDDCTSDQLVHTHLQLAGLS